MKKTTRKIVAVTLSMMMFAETIGAVPVTASDAEVQENLEQEISCESYPTGAVVADSSTISDELKIDSVEEYFEAMAAEEKAEEEGSVTEAELAVEGIEAEETEQEIVELTEGEIVQAQSEAEEAIEALPSEVDNSTSEFFPAIKLQDGGSCVAFAQVYYQFSYTMNKKMNRASTEGNCFSPYFLYNFFGSNYGDKGISDVSAYVLMKNKGCLPWDGVSYDENFADWSPNLQDWEEADNYRLKKYEIISSDIGTAGHYITSPKDSDLDVIKTALNNSEILTFSTYIDSWELNTIESSDIVQENKCFEGETIATDITGCEGPHRMTIVGYNDNIWYDINGDGNIQEAEKGAFKIANSWGTNWGNEGYCWLSYDAINNCSAVITESETNSNQNNHFINVTRIDVDDYDSDSDIKLLYTLNSGARNELDICVTAESGTNTQKKYPTPFYIYDVALLNNAITSYRETESFSFYGNEYAEDATMVMDLDTVVSDLNSENFKDYYWIMNVADRTANDNSCIIKSAKIVDYNTGEIYSVVEELPKTVNGNSYNVTFEKENAKGFDFEISNIGYKNETKNNSNLKIAVGDKIRFYATVTNVGDIKSTDNNKMGVLFSVNEHNAWSDDYQNKQGLLPGKSEMLTANGGGAAGDGTVVFSEPGTYTVTAWVNDVNDFPNEYGGNTADNNKTTLTITVVENEVLDVESISISNEKPVVGEELTFEVKLNQPATIQTSLQILNAGYTPYASIDYTDGTSLKYSFEKEGIYYITFYVKSVVTEEMTYAAWRITVGPAEETTTVVETTTVPDMIVKSFNCSAKEITEGESIAFTVDVENATDVQTKICVANAYGVYLDEGTYVDGTTITRVFESAGVYRVHAVVKDLATGKEILSSSETIVVNEAESPYYDFEITELTYVNVSTDTVGGEIYSGDKVKFSATIKNVGNSAAPDNYKMGVQFQVDGNTYNITWNDEFVNREGLGAGESITLTATGGSSSTDGSWTFSESGTHTVTAWVNDTNDFTDEYGGNEAENNKKTISVEVAAGEFTVGELVMSQDKAKLGDIVTFSVDVQNATNVQTKIVFINPYGKYNPIIEETDYVDGTTVSVEITRAEQLYLYAQVINLDTGEEKTTVCSSINAYETLGGYDFAITDVSYYNVTTGMTNRTTITAGDSIRFSATVKNVGDTVSETNKKLGVQFQINGNTSDITWCDSFTNESGILPYKFVTLQACGGSVNTDGVITFTEPGTYTVTAWVNDTNDYANEVGGNQAENNRKTITITVK